MPIGKLHKRALLISLVVFVVPFMISTSGCSSEPNVNSFNQTPAQQPSPKNNSVTLSHSGASLSAIKYTLFYRGFATIKTDRISRYPQGTYVIETDRAWHEFMDNYVPGIPYFTPLDFSKEYLVANAVLPAKPTYSASLNIKGFSIEGNTLEAHYDPTQGNQIWAQNIPGIEHVFVTIVQINKKYIPAYIQNIYHKKT